MWDVDGINDIEEVRGSRIASGLGRLFSLLPAHLLDGIDERRLVGGSDAEGAHGLSVHSLLIHSALGGLFPHLVGKLMGLEAQQDEAVTQLSSVLHERRQLLGLELTGTQFDETRSQVSDQIFQILESRHRSAFAVSSPKLPAHPPPSAGRLRRHQRGTVNASTTS